ncbi:MAG: hypothetical protein LBL67_01700 [Coriobacteriales bacterium]|jgi:hypothetical protein|nr:hypothetical protein [Coriobacteriales bacterium]
MQREREGVGVAKSQRKFCLAVACMLLSCVLACGLSGAVQMRGTGASVQSKSAFASTVPITTPFPKSGVKNLKQGSVYRYTLNNKTKHTISWTTQRSSSYYDPNTSQRTYYGDTDSLTVYIDGKAHQYGSVENPFWSGEDMDDPYVYLCKTGKYSRLLAFAIRGEELKFEKARLYRYSGQKLKYIGDCYKVLPRYWGKTKYDVGTITKLVSTGTNKINLDLWSNSCSLGSADYRLTLRISNGKIKLASTKARILSVLNSKNGKQTRTVKLFRRLKFYKAVGSKRVSFSLPKGKKVKLEAIAYKHKKTYVEVKRGKKQGWYKEPKTSRIYGFAAAGSTAYFYYTEGVD